MYVETAVSSKAISAIGFDDQTNTITVKFIRGEVYEYPGNKELFQEFQQSRSKGQFWHSVIKPLGEA